MAEFTMSQRMQASPETVFEASANVHGWADAMSGITKVEVLTDGPIGVGTRFAETRVMFGKAHTETMEITAFERPKMYRVECESCGCHYATDMEFTSDGDGTVMSMTMRTRPLTFMAKCMMPLGFLFAGPMKKCIRQDLEDLRRHVEGGPGAAAAPA